jgi:hypothetical protein
MKIDLNSSNTPSEQIPVIINQSKWVRNTVKADVTNQSSLIKVIKQT